MTKKRCRKTMTVDEYLSEEARIPLIEMDYQLEMSWYDFMDRHSKLVRNNYGKAEKMWEKENRDRIEDVARESAEREGICIKG